MDIIPKYKIGTSIPVNKQKVLDYFSIYIDHKNENEKTETYTCTDNSLLILLQSKEENKVFVKFYCNIGVNTQDNSMNFPGKTWFLVFCQENGSGIQNLNTKVIMPASDGAIMSDLFSSEAFRIAKHFASQPKDKPKK